MPLNHQGVAILKAELTRALRVAVLGGGVSTVVVAQPHAPERSLVIANYVVEICKTQNADCSNYLLGVKEGLAFRSQREACFVQVDTNQLRLAFLLYASQLDFPQFHVAGGHVITRKIST